MATAKKLPSGSWRCQASKVIDGKKIRKSFTSADKRQAERLALEWQTDIAQSSANNITLLEAYRRYIDAKRNVLSPSTVRAYEKLSKYSLQDVMHFKVDKLTIEILQRSINIYAADHSPKSVRNCSGLLSAVLKMFRPGFNLNVTLPQKEKKTVYIPTDEDMKTVFKIIKDTEYEIPVMLAAFAGMRQGEICALTSDDVKGDLVIINKSLVLTPEGELINKSPKTFSSYRTVEIPNVLAEKLKDLKGKIVRLTPRALSIGFGRMLKRNNIPHFRFHDLRHYYVSTLHSIGIPDKYIMAQGGWSTNHVMQTVYNHVLADKKSEFSSKASSHFDNINN
jgi:integrase